MTIGVSGAIGLVIGIGIGCIVFVGYMVGMAMLTNCLKNCDFPIWPAYFLIFLPATLVLITHLKTVLRWHRQKLGWSWNEYDFEWIAKRSIPIGIALSSVIFTPWGMNFVDRFVRVVVR